MKKLGRHNHWILLTMLVGSSVEMINKISMKILHESFHSFAIQTIWIMWVTSHREWHKDDTYQASICNNAFLIKDCWLEAVPICMKASSIFLVSIVGCIWLLSHSVVCQTINVAASYGWIRLLKGSACHKQVPCRFCCSLSDVRWCRPSWIPAKYHVNDSWIRMKHHNRSNEK